MADDKHYVPGDFYRIDDRSGFKIRAKVSRKEWTNLIVHERLWEARQPQDFVKGVIDDQTVPDARPRQTDVFLGVLTTTLTANAAAGAIVLNVASATRILINDTVQIMLDTKQYFTTTVALVPTLTSIQIAQGLPYTAASGNIVQDLTAVAPAVI